jgi:hypothetical protein
LEKKEKKRLSTNGYDRDIVNTIFLPLISLISKLLLYDTMLPSNSSHFAEAVNMSNTII